MTISNELVEKLLEYLRVNAEIWHGISDVDKEKAIELMQELIAIRDKRDVSND